MRQPTPLISWVAAIGTDDGGPLTAVNRVWRDDDASRCQLCPRCVRVHLEGTTTAVCTVAVNAHVDPESAALFSLRG